MTPQQLKAFILADSAAAALFAEAQDQLCADRVNAIAPAVRALVDAADLQYYASVNGIWAAIRLTAQSATAPDSIKGVCVTFIDWIEAGRPIDLDLPAVGAMLDALVAATIVTPAQKTEILALGNKPQVVTALEIEFARTRI